VAEPGLEADDREGLPPRLRHMREVGALRPVNIRHLRPLPGMRMSLLRILMTNACTFNCHYCPMRRDRSMPRTLLKPEELVRIFLGAHRRGWCEGLFITTGIPGRPLHVMDELIKALELLRERHRFGGYIHVKLVPGGDRAQIERLTALASRVSLNFEAACGASLAQIAPDKSFNTTLAAFEQVRALVLEERQAELRAGGGVHHAHFSAFRPISDTPMESVPAAPALREHRLYQATYLMGRSYGFSADEVVFQPGGNLPLGLDPKAAWALAHPERFPVEITMASREELVRVPGIGPVVASRVVSERGETLIRGLADLRKLGVITTRAAGFITLRGRKLQTARWTEQLGFWAPEDEVGTHHVVYEVSPGTFR
jgi:predicted DNA-binding helix-hairpin-helix protein